MNALLLNHFPLLETLDFSKQTPCRLGSDVLNSVVQRTTDDFSKQEKSQDASEAAILSELLPASCFCRLRPRSCFLVLPVSHLLLPVQNTWPEQYSHGSRRQGDGWKKKKKLTAFPKLSHTVFLDSSVKLLAP